MNAVSPSSGTSRLRGTHARTHDYITQKFGAVDRSLILVRDMIRYPPGRSDRFPWRYESYATVVACINRLYARRRRRRRHAGRASAHRVEKRLREKYVSKISRWSARAKNTIAVSAARRRSRGTIPNDSRLVLS